MKAIIYMPVSRPKFWTEVRENLQLAFEHGIELTWMPVLYGWEWVHLYPEQRRLLVASWIDVVVVPPKPGAVAWCDKANAALARIEQLGLDGYALVGSDDNLIPPGCWKAWKEALKKEPRPQVLVHSCKRGQSRGESGYPVTDLVAAPENMKVGKVTGEQLWVKAQVLRGFRFADHPCADGVMAELLAQAGPCLRMRYLPEVWVPFNALEPGRWTEAGLKAVMEGKIGDDVEVVPTGSLAIVESEPAPADEGLTLWVPAWGGEALEQLEKYALPSLMQQGNLPAIIKSGVKLYVDGWTTRQDCAALQRILEIELQLVFQEIEMHTSDNPGQFASRVGPGLAHERGTRMLLCPPDQVWGDGSIWNMWRYAKGKRVTVAAAHLRVVDERFARGFAERMFPITNRELVKLAEECSHASQATSWSTEDENCTHGGGISLTYLGNGTTSLVHFLPTPWLCWFTAADVEYFAGVEDNQQWDHEWPSRLVEEGRWRVLGSSSLAFGVELTRAECNVPAVESGRKYFEGYWEGKPHNAVNGSFVIALEG